MQTQNLNTKQSKEFELFYHFNSVTKGKPSTLIHPQNDDLIQ